MNVRVVLLIAFLSLNVFAQAAIEAAAGAARATTTAVPGQKLGNSIKGAFDKLNRALQDTEKAKPTSPRGSATSSKSPASAAVMPAPAPSVPKPNVVFEDPSGIQEGMDSTEVAKRFGPPSLQLTTGPDQETLCYTQKDVNIDVTVRSGKVATVHKTGGTDPAPPAPIK